MPKLSNCQMTALIVIAIASGLVASITFFPKEDRGGVFAFANGLIGIGATYLKTPSNKNNEDS